MTFTGEEIGRIRRIAEQLSEATLPLRIEWTEGEDLRAERKGDLLEIRCRTRSALCRALFFAACRLRERPEETAWVQEEKRHFRELGLLVDVSRGAVMKKETVYRVLERIAALGFTSFYLYTEDLYTLEDYPYFGYMRGRYRPEELREMAAYAKGLDIEMIPCIQTLAHMGSFLQWNDSTPLRDQMTVLMCDEEKVYALIEAEVRAMREVFPGSRIHIGMDEAASVGLGRYYAKHGPVDRYALLGRHLGRVTEICAKYGFRAQAWSDMFFRLASGAADYYDTDVVIPEEALSRLPDLELCYWDYEHTDPAHYARMLAVHEEMQRPLTFAGGIHTWHGFLPNLHMTDATMVPALTVCRERKVERVMATIWGDDGNETDLFLGFSRLALFSEACWQETLAEEDWHRVGAWISGFPEAVSQAMADFFPGAEDIRMGKALLWGDMLYPFIVTEQDGSTLEDTLLAYARRTESAAQVLERSAVGSLEAEYALQVLRLASRKAGGMAGIRLAYASGDREALAREAEKMDEIARMQWALMEVHRRLWMRDFHVQGWELLCRRYGATYARLKDVQTEIREYVSGRAETIPVLEEKVLDARRKGGMQFYQTFAVPSHYL